jgi:hypothetical protein
MRATIVSGGRVAAFAGGAEMRADRMQRLTIRPLARERGRKQEDEQGKERRQTRRER